MSTTHTAHGQLDFDLHDIDEQVGVALEQLIQPETPEDFDRLRDALDRRKGEGRRLWTRARRRLIEQAAARVRLAVDDALPWLRCVVMRSPRGVRVLVLWDRPIACEKAARIMEAIRDRVGDVGGLSRAEVFPTPAGRTGRLALARMRIVDAHGALMHRTRRADLEWLLRHGGAMRHGVAELAELVPRRRTRRRPEPREQTTRGAPSGDDKLCGTDFFAAVVGYLTQGLPRGETWLASHRIAFAAIGLGLGDDDARQLLDHAINHTGHDGACHALTETGRRGAHAMLTHALGRYRRGGMRAGLIADEELRTVVSDVLGVELAAPFQAREVDRARISQIRSAAARRRWAPDRAVDAVTPRRMTTPEFFAALAAA